MQDPFTGNPATIHIKVEPDITPEEMEEQQRLKEEAANKPIDPLASTESEDSNAGFEP